MSTTANAQANKPVSLGANVFVGFMAVCAAATLASAAYGVQSWHRWEFLSLLALATLTARLKLKLPGVNGNMSVSLPFILIAATKLSLLKAVLVAGVSVFIQSIPKSPHRFRMIHALFNMSTGMLATGLGWNTFHLLLRFHFNSALALVSGCAVQFLVSTVPIAAILSLAENANPFRSWNEIVNLSFPYYLASTGLASIASAAGEHSSLPMLVGMSLIMAVTYRSYRLYFGMVSGSSAFPMKVQSAAAAK